MYRGDQARETVRLLSEGRLVMDQDDLEIVGLTDLPGIHQMMLDGTMTRPKGVALVQADRAGRSVAEYESEYLGHTVAVADADAGRFIDIRVIDQVAVVTLTRPEALNALNEELVSQLADLVGQLEAGAGLGGEEVSGLIIRGAGRAFVAGADIGVFVGKSAAEIEQLAVANMAVFTSLENLPIPVVSVVNGFALGGGNELAMSTHYRIVTENAALGQPEVKLGIIPGYGGMQRLPRLMGPRRAAEMAVNGEAVDGAEAVRIGLAHEQHPSCTALSRAFRVIGEFRAGTRPLPRSDWDALAAGQSDDLAALMDDDEVSGLLDSPTPDAASVGDLVAARRYAAKFALMAMQPGDRIGFDDGLRNDARLFGEIVTSASGQHWIDRFLVKDPEQSSFLTQLAPKS